MQDGQLVYEYNLFEVERTRMRSASKIPAGDVVIEVKSRLQEARAISPLDVVVSVDGKEVCSAEIICAERKL